MTRERDRIQENANKYVVKNCPCYVYYEDKLRLCCDGQGDGECQDCTDCVIKQIVELCKHYKKHSDCGRDCPSFGSFLNKLLNKLDVDDINKWR